MIAAASSTRTFWHSGGTIVMRGRALPLAEARTLLAFHRRQMGVCRDLGDEVGASFCAARRRELARAVREFRAWRRAASAAPALAPHMKNLRYG